MRLENKVAVISGGARGIGASITGLFAREGAKVVIGDILEEEGRHTAAAITDGGGDCVFVRLDVTNESDWEKAFGEAISRFGRLDILVNNAGISARGNVEETSEAEWTRTMDINVKGAFLDSKQAIPFMRTAGGGSIINISSGAYAPQPGTSGAYAASKGAVRIFSKSTAIQYAQDNIRCNSVHPGPIETDMLRATRPDDNALDVMMGRVPLGRFGRPEEIAYGVLYLASQYAQDNIRCNSVHPGPIETDMLRATRPDDNALNVMMGRVPLGRFGRPEEIAYGVLYLASDESSFVTGSELVIDGGRTAQ